MNESSDPALRDGFEGRLLVALTEVDQRKARSTGTEPVRPVRRRPVLLAAAAATLLAVGGATAAVAAFSGGQTSFAAAAHTVTAGDAVTVKGSGCEAGSDVRFTAADGRELGRVVADAGGSFVTNINLPSDLATGDLTLAANCPDGSPHGLVQRVVVVVVHAHEPLGATLAVAGSAKPGGQVVVKGAGCQPGTDVTFTVPAAPTLGSATAGADGTYVATLVVPSTLPIGSHVLTAECTGHDGMTLRLTVDLVLVE